MVPRDKTSIYALKKNNKKSVSLLVSVDWPFRPRKCGNNTSLSQKMRPALFSLAFPMSKDKYIRNWTINNRNAQLQMLLGVGHSGIVHTTLNKFENRALFLPLGHSNPDPIRKTPFRPDRNLKTLAVSGDFSAGQTQNPKGVEMFATEHSKLNKLNRSDLNQSSNMRDWKTKAALKNSLISSARERALSSFCTLTD